jgi:hypothetical protein
LQLSAAAAAAATAAAKEEEDVFLTVDEPHETALFSFPKASQQLLIKIAAAARPSVRPQIAFSPRSYHCYHC